jgi:hypothetical protein
MKQTNGKGRNVTYFSDPFPPHCHYCLLYPWYAPTWNCGDKESVTCSRNYRPGGNWRPFLVDEQLYYLLVTCVPIPPGYLADAMAPATTWDNSAIPIRLDSDGCTVTVLTSNSRFNLEMAKRWEANEGWLRAAFFPSLYLYYPCPSSKKSFTRETSVYLKVNFYQKE